MGIYDQGIFEQLKRIADDLEGLKDKISAQLIGMFIGVVLGVSMIVAFEYAFFGRAPCVQVNPNMVRQALKASPTLPATLWLVEQRGSHLSGVMIKPQGTPTPTRRVIKPTATPQPYPAWPTWEVYP
jgi:hypothetical protein